MSWRRAGRLPAKPADTLDLARCEQFLMHEARLLDESKFDGWLALFTADAWYWVPSEPNQDNPHETVSLMYDDRRLLETRVRRLASPRMYSQEPRSRCSRLVGNVTLEDVEGRAATVRSKFLMIEYRREQQRLFAGTALHRLVQIDGAIRIAWKRGRPDQLRRADGRPDATVLIGRARIRQQNGNWAFAA